MATVSALGASFNGDDITMEQLIGKPIKMKKVKTNDKTEDWKNSASKRGLRSNS